MTPQHKPVFIVKYLKSFGFAVNNDVFAANSWYFRNALVRANYNNLQKGIHATSAFLELFFENLLLGAQHELKNRYLHGLRKSEDQIVGEFLRNWISLEKTIETEMKESQNTKSSQSTHALFHFLKDQKVLSENSLHKVQCHQQLIARICAVQIQRAVKAHIHRCINEVNPVILVFQKVDDFAQQHRAVRQGIEIVQNLIAVPVFDGLSPKRNIKHLEHPFFDHGQLIKVDIVQTRQQIQ